ncbi:MAG: PDZ domain-containing protein [Gammaproteobacteria bacterium]|nr:PDZ domain-containing protein [Gammaproteobacteria bacterium]
MLRLIPFAIILVLSGVIVGLNIQTTPDNQPQPLPAPSIKITPDNRGEKLNQLQQKVERLEKNLDTEIENRSKLNKQLTSLTLAINALKEAKNEIPSSMNDGTNGQTLTDVNEPRLTEPQKNKNILVSMGVNNENASRIQRLAEKKEMEQLYLRNTAVREGWFGTEKYFEKTRELDLKSNIYREELGDDKYDQFLYASQLTNRITVQSVLSESPAEIAGLQSGDYILSYDSKRVFNWSDLTALTANGAAGESVPVEVQRNGQVLQYFIARGPLGIRLSSERINPNLP